MPEPVAREFASFIEYHSAKQLSRNLRKMLFEFMMHESSAESLYLKDLFYDMDGLFDLLDSIESVQAASRRDQIYGSKRLQR